MFTKIQNTLENNVKFVLLGMLAIIAVLAIVACSPNATSNDRQREEQNKIVQQGVSQVGLPAIKNFRELRLAKDIYELRDQTGLTTYSYVWSDVQAKMVFFCESIGYPLPYGVQFTSPETMQTYNITDSGGGVHYYGDEKLPQAEPNGLFSPATAEGTWVMCKDPASNKVLPVYSEPRIIVSQFKMQ